MQMKHRAAARVLSAAAAVGLYAALAANAQDGMTTVVPGNKQWQMDAAMPFGMRVMYLYGHPSQPGPYIYRVRVPTGYKLPPVKYPDERVTTVLKGTLWNAQGERYDPMKMEELQAGSMFVTPAGTPHFQWARTEVILQVMGTGPVPEPVKYVNPDDDPRNE